LDGGFVGLMPLERDRPGRVAFVPWRKEPLVAMVPSGHPLAARSMTVGQGKRKSHPSLPLKDFAGESFVAVAGAAAPAFSTYVRRLCHEAGFRPRIVLEASRAQAVAVMVAAGSGVALLPESLAPLMGEAVAVVRLKEAPLLTHVFAHSGGSRLTGAMAHFVRSFRG
jgi:DNA-binding transcriptional LysR family regulator